MLSSCCRFLGARSSITRFIRTYRTAISSIVPSRYSSTGIAGYDPGSCVVVGSSGVEETVDSVSCVIFDCIRVSFGGLSRCWWDFVVKIFEISAPRCVSRHSSLLRSRMSIFLSLFDRHRLVFWGEGFFCPVFYAIGNACG